MLSPNKKIEDVTVNLKKKMFEQKEQILMKKSISRIIFKNS